MGTERKLLTCQNCEQPFTAPLSKGRYPTYCTKTACQRIRHLRSNGAFSVATPEQREQRREKQRERDQARRDASSEQLLAERLADRDEIIRRLRSKLSDAHAELEREPERPPLDPSSEAILELAGSLNGVSRPDLTASVRRLAYARGEDQTYAQLVEVAAVATAWARRVQPSESYGELVAA